MTVELMFKDLPVNNEEILKNCRKFHSFSHEGGYHVLRVSREELMAKPKRFEGIFNRIKPLKSSRFFIDNQPSTPKAVKKVLEAVICEKQCRQRQECIGDRRWGCNFLDLVNPISRNNGSEYWYTFGSFDENNVWIINKNHIRELILNQAQESGADQCAYFDTDSIEKRLGELPDSINPHENEEWEYLYAETDSNSPNRTPIGVKPRGQKSSVNSEEEGIKNPIKGILDEIKREADSFINSLGEHLDEPEEADKKSTIPDPFKSALNPQDEEAVDILSSINFDSFSSIFDDFLGFESSSHRRSSSRYIPETSFSEIGGLEDTIRTIREVIELPVVAPELLEYYKIKPHKGILLYGPPGCGKTLIAKAIAHEIQAHFICVSGPEVLNKYYGQSEENLREIFKEAESKQPSIIYFDEFDALATRRNDDKDPLNARIVNQILTLLDGINEKSKIITIASTNRIDMIDEAVKRPGRFDYLLEIPRPSKQGCKEIFGIYTAQMPIEKTFDKNEFVEEKLVGCTGAEIFFVAMEAAYNSIRRTVDLDTLVEGRGFKPNSENIITEADFEKAYRTLLKNRKGEKK